jgi:succinate dehydrogenase / fumarate reductase cytochrome b subunit
MTPMTDTPARRAPPLSPHLQVWRWHITMFGSIAHRATGIGLYVGALILAGWAMALASGPQGYQAYLEILGHPLGKLVLFGITVAVCYHLLNGVRHLVWDTGHGLDLRSANLSGWIVTIGSVVLALAFWVAAFLMGVV